MNARVVEIIENDMCGLFRFEPETMFDMKLEYGIRYLERMYSNEPELRNALAHSQVFWTWFRMIWANTDRQLLTKIKVTAWGINFSTPHNVEGETWFLSRRYVWNDVQDLYMHFHKMDVDSTTLKPNTIVINKALQELEEELIKSN